MGRLYLLTLGLAAICWTSLGWPVEANMAAAVQWIWGPKGEKTVYFRKAFDIDRPFAHPTDEAHLDITADRGFKVWLNGQKVGEGSDAKRVFRFDVNHLTVPGRNVIAVEAEGGPDAQGLLVRLGYIPNGRQKMAVLSDGTWRATIQEPGDDWTSVRFNDRTWSRVRVLGAYGQVEPWKQLTWDAGGDDRFTVPPGFVVEIVVPPNPNKQYLPAQLPFSLINMAFDAQGRLLVAQERGPVLLCTDPDEQGQFKTIKPYCTAIQGCQGMCWVDDALLLVGDGPKGTGLYRVRCKPGQDVADQVESLHSFRGGMGEHGPHAILHGPDGWLYVVIGNHAWATPKTLSPQSPLRRWPSGGMGPDQGQPRSTEDVLLPRLNDARGHAANILAPGGTIWRMDKEGQNLALVSAGYRNHFDAAFTRSGDLITYDSDMEWDEGLPWYRPTRVCHAFFGSDFLWRTGAANTPDYYIDSLAPLAELGRGSPVGVECYQHHAFPAKYHGAVFLADWSAGVIYAWLMDGSNPNRGTMEKFCLGTPLNIVDMAVGPEGALYFCTGGRGSEGSVFRIRHVPSASKPTATGTTHAWASPLDIPQPYSAWGRAQLRHWKEQHPDEWRKWLVSAVQDNQTAWPLRVNALHFLRELGPVPTAEQLHQWVRESTSPELRAQLLAAIGQDWAASPGKEPTAIMAILSEGLRHPDPLVRRRACEAFMEAGLVPAIEQLWPCLGDQDRAVRTVARLVLQRIPAQDWIQRLASEPNDAAAMEAIVALYKENVANDHAKVILERLARVRVPSQDRQARLNELRVWQLLLMQLAEPDIRPAAEKWWTHLLETFPDADDAISREQAILLTHGRRLGWIAEPVHRRIWQALERKSNDPAMQIHYFYCLRLLHQGWSLPEKKALLAWFQTTTRWRGGFSFGPFLENMLVDWQRALEPSDWHALLENADHHAAALSILLQRMPKDVAIAPKPFVELFRRLHQRAEQPSTLKEALVMAVAQQLPSEEAQAALRLMAELDDKQRDAVARGLATVPSEENWPFLVRGLHANSPLIALDCLRALKKIPKRPSLEEPAPFRAVLTAAARIDPKERRLAVELLREWTQRRFSLEEDDWTQELPAWGQWFVQSFPKEPPLANVKGLTAESKWKFEELLQYLEHDPKGKGDPVRGKAVFTKANCIKCHKYGREGEGIGPDLTNVRQRFKRDYILESTLYPSKVIADQYRGSLIMTKKGKQISGLAAPQGDTMTILQIDGTKITLAKDEIESIVSSTISAMPERLLDDLTLEEIADLFAYLESDPEK